MKRALGTLAAIALTAGVVSATEVRLRNGTVLEAVDYTVTGSYVMVTLPGGGRVAYDITDVDLEALRAAESMAAGAEEAQSARPVQAEAPGDRGLTLPPANPETSGIAITDHDVRHTWQDRAEEGDATAAADQSAGAALNAAPPPGFEQGGGVVLNNLRVTGQGEGRWIVEGDVINRTARPVVNVRVQLQTLAGPDGGPWSAEVAVTNTLPPDQVAVFSHSFSAPVPEGRAHPDIRASVLWMQDQGPRQPVLPPASRAPGPVGPVPTPEV